MGTDRGASCALTRAESAGGTATSIKCASTRLAGKLERQAHMIPRVDWKSVAAYSAVTVAFASTVAWALSKWLGFDFLSTFLIVTLWALPSGLAIESAVRTQVELRRPDRHCFR